MKLSKLFKVGAFVFASTLALTSCDEETEFAVGQVFETEISVKNASGTEITTEAKDINIKDILEEGDKIKDLELVAVGISLETEETAEDDEKENQDIIYTGGADDFKNAVFEVIVGGETVSTFRGGSAITVSAGQVQEFIFTNALAIQSLLTGDEISAIVKISNISEISDPNFQFNVRLDVRAVATAD
ncbi:hypothetical protein ACXGQW_07565 [Wenyingzhuangia sp. IMCC45533]